MKAFIIAAGIALLAAAPVRATGGLLCSTGGEPRIRLALVISHTVVPSIVSVRMTDNGREVPVAVAQSWLDGSEVRIDLVDRNAVRHEARLSAKWSRSARSYDGSMWRHGQRRWIRCREG